MIAEVTTLHSNDDEEPFHLGNQTVSPPCLTLRTHLSTHFSRSFELTVMPSRNCFVLYKSGSRNG